MRFFITAISSVAAMLFASTAPRHAQDTIKIGLIMTLSGQFADAGIQMRKRRQDLHEAARRHGRRQEDRD